MKLLSRQRHPGVVLVVLASVTRFHYAANFFHSRCVSPIRLLGTRALGVLTYLIASRIPPGLFVWLLGRSMVWSFGVFLLGRDADAQKTAVDFSIQLRCRADPPPRLSSWAVKLIGGWMG